MDLLLKTAVHLVQMALLDADLAVAYGVVLRGAYGIDGGSSGFYSGILRGHRGPLHDVHWAAVNRTRRGRVCQAPTSTSRLPSNVRTSK